MPSVFDTLFTKSAIPLLMDNFGVTVTYTPVGPTPGTHGSPRTFQADVTRGGTAWDKETHHGVLMEGCTVFCPRNSVTGITNPQVGDSLTIAGDTNPIPWDFKSEDPKSDTALIAVTFARAKIVNAGQRPSSL